jgi:acetyl-CoA C-acetyltransferase
VWRNIAVIGVGQTKHGIRRDINAAEMIAEAAWKALEDAELGPEDIDAIAIGNMQGFGGICQAELWSGDLFAAPGKPVLRIATGGTTGGSVAQCGMYQVASGLFDTVLAIGFEKHSDSKEPGATMGLSHVGLANMFHLLANGVDVRTSFAYGGGVGAAAGVSAYQACEYMHRSGCKIEHLDMVAAKSRRNAAKNKYAHLQWPNCTAESLAKHPRFGEIVAYPLRLGHICPASDGASAIVIASEEIARKADRPAWVRGLAACADEENQQAENAQGVSILDTSEQMQCRIAAMKAYRMAGIKNPREEIDVAEIYQPFPHQELMYSERLLLFDDGKAWIPLEEGETEIDGKLPIDPSGGVLSTNAIGSSAMQRVAECALQIMGKAEEHQVPKDVKNAVAHGWGGSTNFTVVTVLGDKPRLRW